MKPRALFPSPSSSNTIAPVPVRAVASTSRAEFSTSNAGAGNDTKDAIIAAFRGAITHLEESCEAVAALDLPNENDSTNAQMAELHAQIEMLQADLRDASDLIEALQTQNENLASENARAEENNTQLQRNLSQIEAQFADLESLGLQTENLLQQFGPLCDLQTEDLPAQILRSACEIAGAEVGLLTDAGALDAVATRGLPELSPRVAYELFEFTQRVHQSQSLIIENEAAQTLAHCEFSNLIALPLAPHHPGGGVLLLANKRDGDFGAQDEYLLTLLEKQIVVALENARICGQREQFYFDSVALLADAIETKDAYNRGHCESVMRLAVDVGRRLELRGDALDEVRYAALLHDIGKVGVPDGILLNTGRLSDEEQAIMRTHAAIGRDLVCDVAALEPLSGAILHHHEKWDGSGYPAGLVGEEIPLAARIVGAVDAFDAMTTPRLYRGAISAQEALDEMKRCAGTQFDPQVVEVLDALLQEGQKTQEHCAARIEKAARPDALKRSQEQSNYLIQVMEQEELEESEQNNEAVSASESSL